MRHIVKGVLNLLPRTFLQRVAGVCVPVLGLFYIGKGRVCPICGTQRRKFLPYGYSATRDNALCPHCLSLERHRLLWLYLRHDTALLTQTPPPILLHIAPEVALKRRFEEAYTLYADRYITADLESPLSRLHFDVQEIPMADESVDVLICNHLLEHVADDRKALSELYRILRYGGWGVLLSPVDMEREVTDEGLEATTPEERKRRFGQYDHRRAYGRDYAERLRSAGFEVEELDYAATFDAPTRRRYALSDEHLYIVRKSATQSESRTDTTEKGLGNR